MKFDSGIKKFNMKIPIIIELPLVMIGSWIFQGILGMDRTEKTFKIFLEIFLFIPIFLGFIFYFNFYISIITSFIISHSINWILFGEKFVWMKNFGLIQTDLNKYYEYIERVKIKASHEKSILLVAACGSIARNELKETSDLDIRIVRKKGFLNGFRACIFIMKERFWAFLNKFPLDILLLDDETHFLKNDEPRSIVYS
jgi:predicted nucleotidyltransferase